MTSKTTSWLTNLESNLLVLFASKHDNFGGVVNFSVHVIKDFSSFLLGLASKFVFKSSGKGTLAQTSRPGSCGRLLMLMLVGDRSPVLRLIVHL